MANIKHVGRLKTNKRRVVVAYRTLPGDPYNALVIFTDSLPSDEHDVLYKLVDSQVGQDANELAEAMARTYLPDGRGMLIGFHQTGRLAKIATSDIEMLPNNSVTVGLDELNQIIAKQRGVSVEDLALKPSTTEQRNTPAQTAPVAAVEALPVAGPLTDADLATRYRAQADAMYKEAKRLRDEAEKLVPTKRKAPSVKE